MNRHHFDAALTSVIAQQLQDSMLRMLELDGPERPLGMTEENRKEYVDNVLLTKVCCR